MSNIVQPDFNPFDPPPGSPEWQRKKVDCQIIVAGVNVTNRLMPFLISVTVMDKVDYSDECIIDLDDRDARLPLPALGDPVEVSLGWANEGLRVMFQGTVWEVGSMGSRQSGRLMRVHALGPEWLGAGKSPIQLHDGEGEPPGGAKGQSGNISFNDFMSKVADQSGLNTMVSPSLGGKKRDYWSAFNESAYNFARRAAHEMGGVIKINGNTIAIMKPMHDVKDQPMPTVIAEWGRNLISWEIYPLVARPAWGETNSQFYNFAKAQWDKVGEGVMGGRGLPFGLADSVNMLPQPAPNASVGGEMNEGESTNSQAKAGSGHLVINGEPSARAQWNVQVIGVRPGVDGKYGIFEADHVYSREGYTTRLELWYPTGGTFDPIWRERLKNQPNLPAPPTS